jgi:hypothetical protein
MIEQQQRVVEQESAAVDWNFEKRDFESAMKKLRSVAALYDSSHTSAANLNIFSGKFLCIGIKFSHQNPHFLPIFPP